MRINKYLAECGVCSRRKADELVTEGRVTLNGKKVAEPGVDVGERDTVFGRVNARQPLFAEILPLSLEEIFICEMEGMGYDVDKIIV